METRDITDLDMAREIALRRITARARSAFELRKDLIQRQVSPEVADQVVTRFIEVGLVDDAEFARAWVRSRSATKSLSRTSLRRELIAKGIGDEEISQALDEMGGSDEEVALDLARRKISGFLDQDKATITRRLSGYLLRRGFSYSVIQNCVRQVINEVGSITGDE